MKYIFSSVTHFLSNFLRGGASGSLVMLLTTILLGACTQAEMRGEGREEDIYPGESVAGRTIPYVPDPDSILLPEDFYPDEEAVFPGESVTGRTIPYAPDSAPPPEDFGNLEEETTFPGESTAAGTVPDVPDPDPDELAETEPPESQETSPDASAELPKIPEAAVVAVKTTTQDISHAVLEEQIAPEKVLFPDAEGEITSEEEDMAVVAEEETVSEEKLIDVIREGEEDLAALAENETDTVGKSVDTIGEREDITPVAVEGETGTEEDIAFLVEEGAVSEGEAISATKTTGDTSGKGALPENLPFTVVALTPSEQPSFSSNRHAASDEILVEDEEQTNFASEEMFIAVDETAIPGASIGAVLADAAVSEKPPSSGRTDDKIAPVSETVDRPENAPGSGFGNAFALGGGLGEAAKGSTYPANKRSGSGRYDPAPDPGDPPQGIFGTKGISLFSNSSRRSESESDGNLSINSFLWRATLETLSFMPLASADPFGGVIITDWHINPDSAGERFKVVAYILDSDLRVGALRISVFRQQKDSSGAWQDAVTDENVHVQLETAILNRARELRLSWIEEQEG